MDLNVAHAKLAKIRQNIEGVIVGKGRVIDRVLCALICGGHVLIEDVPGLGKTTLVSALARSLGCSFSRIQFTPDTLPSDITGFTLYDIRTGEKQTQMGAVVSQIVLADEINRTSPKTQSSLLEAMQERQVTIDGQTYPLPELFMVLATQNPIDLGGTYPLPEAQLDRFLLCVGMGYPSRDEEIKILQRDDGEQRLKDLIAVADAEDIMTMRALVRSITRSPGVLDYIVSIAAATRSSDLVSLGVSPRGSLALMNAASAHALMAGRDYLMPDDVAEMAESALCHRIVVSPQASLKGATARSIIAGILKEIRVPIPR